MDDQPPCVPEWVVTYGDMMSLLLTFFIMLVALSDVQADQKYQAVLEALQAYGAYPAGAASPPGKNFPANSLIAKLESLGSFTNEEKGRGGVKRPGMEGDSLRVTRLREGTPQTVGDPIRFAVDQTVIPESMEPNLLLIAAELAGKPNKISVRGHTAPSVNLKEDHFEVQMILSYERARAVWTFLRDAGIEEDRMRITAVGEAEPGEPSTDQTAFHPDRVEVIILDAFADEFVGPKDRTD